MIFFQYIIKLPHFFYLYIKDLIIYYREKLFLNFEGWGLHLYVGKFGSGKTLAMVHEAYILAKKYPQLTIVSNVALANFPSHTQILPLNSPKDILDAPPNTLVLIDEIGTIFNSRDFASKNALPKILFQHICQCRKRRLQILATTQVWGFLDKQLRDITAYVYVCRSHFAHPFTRITGVRCYDAIEYDIAYINTGYPISPVMTSVFVATDFVRSLYDTTQLIQTIMNSKYISDSEILENQGDISRNVINIEKKKAKKTV